MNFMEASKDESFDQKDSRRADIHNIDVYVTISDDGDRTISGLAQR